MKQKTQVDEGQLGCCYLLCLKPSSFFHTLKMKKKSLSISAAPSFLNITIEDTTSFIYRLNSFAYYSLVVGSIALHFSIFQRLITSWSIIGLCVALGLGTVVRKETVTLTEEGCQLRATCISGMVSRNTYIPLGEISDIVINEGLVCYSSELYLAFVRFIGNDKNEKRYHVLFEYTKLDRASITKIYSSVKNYLKEHTK